MAPWRQPGADLGAFFNYGLGEKSWRAYAEAMRKVRWEAWHRENVITTVDSGPRTNFVIDDDMPEELRAEIEVRMGRIPPKMRPLAHSRNPRFSVICACSGLCA